MKRILAVAGMILMGLMGSASVASAKPPKLAAGAGPGACGFKSLPLAVGNSWTYKSGPAQVVVKVAAINPGKDWQGKAVTAIDVEEQDQDHTTKTQWTCSAAGGLSVPVDSFFFAGEPGGSAGTTYTITAHDKPWLIPEELLVGDVAWVEIVRADVARADTGSAGAQHLPGKIEIERHAQLKGTESVVTTLGQFSAEKVTFEYRGRATIDDQKAEIPIKRPAVFWYTKGVGLVKIDDAFDRSWELSESSLVVAK